MLPGGGELASRSPTLEFTGHKVLQFFSVEAACVIGVRQLLWICARKKGSDGDETRTQQGFSSRVDLRAFKLLSVSARTHRHAPLFF